MKTSLLLPYLDSIKRIANQLEKKGWAEKNAGNFSIRITDFPKTFLSNFSTKEITLDNNFPALANQVILVKAKGKCFRDIAIDPSIGCILLFILSNGEGYRFYSLNDQQTSPEPTSELLSHLLIQEYLIKNRPKINSILHTHPLELIIISHLMKHKNQLELNEKLLSMHVEIPIFLPEGIGFVPYQIPGSYELALDSCKELEKRSVLVWERHGCLGIGETLVHAFDLIDIANKAATIFIGLSSISREENG